MVGNPIQFDYTVLLTLLFPMLFTLIFFVFVVYLMVSAIRYFNRKTSFDKELLHKLDEIIKLQTQQYDKKTQ